MQVRAVLTAAGLVAGLAAFAAPLTPPVLQRYKVTETNHQVVDLSAVGQPEQTTHIVTSYWISVTSADSAGGRSLKLVIDSAHGDSIESAQPIPPEIFDSARGITATAWLSADGALEHLAGVGERGVQAANLLKALYPKLKPRAKNGDKWTDTTESTGLGSGMFGSAQIRRVTNWAVNGEETVGGAKARKVDGAYSQSISGQMESGQGTMSVDGTGTGTVGYAITADGRPLRATIVLNLQLAIVVPQVPEPIPVNGTVTTSFNSIR
jgi:hypothetical protein